MRNYIIHFFTVIVFFSCQMSAHAQNAVQDCEKDIIKLWAEGIVKLNLYMKTQKLSLIPNGCPESSVWLRKVTLIHN